MGHDGWRGKKCWRIRGKNELKVRKHTTVPLRTQGLQNSAKIHQFFRLSSEFGVFLSEYTFAFICRIHSFSFLQLSIVVLIQMSLNWNGKLAGDTSAEQAWFFSLSAFSLTFGPAHPELRIPTTGNSCHTDVSDGTICWLTGCSETLLAVKKTLSTWLVCTDWVAMSGFTSCTSRGYQLM